MARQSPRPPKTPTPKRRTDLDERVVLRNVSWDQYVALRETDDTPALRMSYLEGTLEIMSPSGNHDYIKTILARLIETYAEETGLSVNGYGSTTYRKKAKERGLEADESYTVGNALHGDVSDAGDPIPDFALEVVLTSGGLDKLEIYRGLGVREVWFWVEGRIHIFALIDDEYEPRPHSELIPGIDLDEIAQIVDGLDPWRQTETIREYRAALRARRSR